MAEDHVRYGADARVKTTTEDRALMRKMFAREGKSIKDIAIHFKLNRTTVSKIVNMKAGYGE